MDWIEKRNRTILDFINKANNPEEIVTKVKDDPLIGKSPPRAYGIRLSLAKSILQKRNSLPGEQFTSIAEIHSIRGVGPDTLNDIFFSCAPAQLSCDYPVLLFPVRLETRFIDNELLVRIYPDDICIELHNRNLSDIEKEAGKSFLELWNTALTTESKRDAWHGFAERFGPGRAAWIFKKVRESIIDESVTSGPVVRVLPDCFMVTLYQGDKSFNFIGNPIPDKLPLMTGPADQPDLRNPLYNKDAAWVWDFNSAVKLGMALRIDLNSLDLQDNTYFDRIVVVGINRKVNHDEGRALLGQLFENHLYTHGLSFLPYGTPTNNTQNVKSDYSKSVSIFKDGPEKDNIISDTPNYAVCLAESLGIDTSILILSGNSNLSEFPLIKEFQETLWPALGDYYLNVILSAGLSNQDRLNVWTHFSKFVRARGPLPAIRTGKQPYGVLSVTAIRNWGPSEYDNEAGHSNLRQFDTELHSILKNLFDMWLKLAESPEQLVPKVGKDEDPDRELLRILAMAPHAVSYKARLQLDERFTAWSLNATKKQLFGGYADIQAEEWALKWFEKKEAGSQVLSGIYNNKNWSDANILKLFNWAQAKDIPIPFARDHTTPENPLEYLNLFKNDEIPGEDPSKPLLYELLRCGILFQKKLSNPLSSNGTHLRSLIDRISQVNPDVDQLENLLRDIFDLHSHRLDAWLSSFAVKRLQAMRKKPGREQGIFIGAYGWIENLCRAPKEITSNEGGYIHAPSLGQAAAGAVLRNAYLTHRRDNQGNSFKINLNSRRVRRALRIIDGVREGQRLSDLLGYIFERGLHDRNQDIYISAFRSAYPLLGRQGSAESVETETIATRNVVDGLRLAGEWRDDQEKVRRAIALNISESVIKELNELTDALDSVSDLLLYESVYQSVQGNYERSGAALEAMSGAAFPPLIESVKTKPTGTLFGQKVSIILNEKRDFLSQGVREFIEPTLAAWFDGLLGNMDDVGCSVYIDQYLDAQGQSYHPVNLNQALQSELENLPGMDREKAAAIVEYRCHRPFFRMEDLNDVPGMYPYLVDKLKEQGLITINPLVVRLDQLRIGPLDFLYLASVLPGEGETELEQRLKYYVRQQNQLDPNSELRIDFDRTDGFTARSFSEAVELGRRVFESISGATALGPEALCHPDEKTSGFTYDYSGLHLKLRLSCLDLSSLALELEQAVELPDPMIYFYIGYYGIEGSIPPSPLRDPDPEGRKNSVLKIIHSKTEKCDQLLKKAETNQDVKLLIDAAKIIFGNSFVVIPPFTASSHNYQSMISSDYQKTSLKIKNNERIYLWLQQAAETHEAIRRFEEMLMAAEAWQASEGDIKRAESSLIPRVIQLATEQCPWMALSDEELRTFFNKLSYQEWQNKIKEEGRPRGVQSIICLMPQDIDFTRPIAGFLVDQWDEFIPGESQVTGVSFKYDRPNAQAPQALLVAVPGTWDANESWTHLKIQEIVNDTADLVKVRTVDLDAMKQMGQFTPALFLPSKPDNPHWYREAAVLHADFTEFGEGSTLGESFEIKGFVFNNLSKEQPLKIKMVDFSFPDLKLGDSYYDGIMPKKALEFGAQGILIDLPWPATRIQLNAAVHSSPFIKIYSLDRQNQIIAEETVTDFNHLPTFYLDNSLSGKLITKVKLTGGGGQGVINQIVIRI